LSGAVRARWRRKRFEILNALGLARRGWFIPYRYLDASPPPREPYPEAAFEAALPEMRRTLEAAAAYRDAWPGFAGRPEPPTPRFDQDWFPGLDAALLYGLVRARRPRRIVEVGSGHSTRFAAAAIRDEGLDARIHAIDPAPRAAIERLAPIVELTRAPVQAVGFGPFAALAPGDILFVDSSHVLMPGSDVDILFNRVLPRLPVGVLVHVHDIFLPDPYPADWDWRGYNEQNAAAALIGGGGYGLLASSRFAETRMADDVRRLFADLPPSPPGARAASLWLEKRVGAA